MTSKLNNKKGEVKLFAAVAVLVMVFAFAGAMVLVDSDVEATGEKPITLPTGSTLDLLDSTGQIEAGKYYYVTGNDVVLGTINITGSATIYLVEGAKVTFPASITGTVVVYAAIGGSSTTAPSKYMEGLSYNATANEVVIYKSNYDYVNLSSTAELTGISDYAVAISTSSEYIYVADKNVTVGVSTGNTTIAVKEGSQAVVQQKAGTEVKNSITVRPTSTSEEEVTIGATVTPGTPDV